MKTYIGTKIIKAKPMTKQEYCDYRGWAVPNDEDPNEEVMLVEYPIDPLSKPNHKDHKGYISMSPKFVFDKAYHIAETWKDREPAVEYTNLIENIDKLAIGLESTLIPKDQIGILSIQLKSMQDYASI